MTNDAYSEFCEALKKRIEKGKMTKFPKYSNNLCYDANGIYSYGSRIADLNLDNRTIRNLGSWSKTSVKHYNYAKHMLKICYDFEEVTAPKVIQRELLHVQNLSYDDHT